VVVFVGKWITDAPCQRFPSLCELSVNVHASGLCRGCQGIGCGGVGLSSVYVVLSWPGRVGKLSSMVGRCVSEVWGAGYCICVASAAYVIGLVIILMSGACPSIWPLSVYEKPGAAVVPWWNPMRCSLNVAIGSDNVSL
jgi:hypothetical protein